ncbi:MAG: hypothetical protein IJK60_09710 [Clostridia bacterium]|nr:hypothetical protein [Clostridia bacterium]
MKKLSILFFVLMLSFCACSCGKTEKTAPDITEKETVPVAEEGATGIESQEALNLKNYLPEYEFDEIIEEHYEEGSNDYYIHAKATKQQFDEYVELCKEAGFTHRVDGAEDPLLYNAFGENGAEVSVTYSEKTSSVFVLVYLKNI